MSARKPLVAIVSRPSERVALDAARAGFHGLVASTVRPQALARTIAAVLRGELAFPRSTLSAMLRSATSGRRGAVPLTSRQRQVVALIASGATDGQIARALGISSSTAHKHVLGAFRRMNVRTRGQLVAAVGLLQAAPW
jgi:DNA-binding NarL/FixJ family response regulator